MNGCVNSGMNIMNNIPDIRTGNTQPQTVDSIPEPVPPKKNVFRRTWDWFNGKKTIIGGSAALIGIGLTKIANPICQATGWIIQGIAYPLTATGIVHKMKKTDKAFGEAGEIRLDESTWKTILKLLWAWLSKVIWPIVRGWFGL